MLPMWQRTTRVPRWTHLSRICVAADDSMDCHDYRIGTDRARKSGRLNIKIVEPVAELPDTTSCLGIPMDPGLTVLSRVTNGCKVESLLVYGNSSDGASLRLSAVRSEHFNTITRPISSVAACFFSRRRCYRQSDCSYRTLDPTLEYD